MKHYGIQYCSYCEKVFEFPYELWDHESKVHEK